MIIRVLIPIIAVVLFYLEPVFGLFSPIRINGEYVWLIPRFVIVFLIFVAVYYSKNRAILYAIFFGLLYDMFFIDIIGLYAFLYPILCLAAAFISRFIHQNLFVTTLLALVLVAVLEIVLYEFYSVVGQIDVDFTMFVGTRLIPTMIANSLFLLLLGWVFKYVISVRSLKRTSSQMM